MDTLAVLGILIAATLAGSIVLKTLMEKRRIERARQLVDLHDDIRRMQTALAVIPELYLDTPSKIFMIRRLMQLIEQVEAVGNESDNLNMQLQDLQLQLDKTLAAKDDSVKRLGQWAKVPHTDMANEIRSLIKFLHEQMLISVKSGALPRAHGARVVKNLKVMAHRVALDVNYNLAQNALKTQKLRPALGKLRMALSMVTKSPIKQYLKKQKEELEGLIEQTEKQIISQRKQANRVSATKLASGMDKMEEEDQWQTKRNLYDKG